MIRRRALTLLAWCCLAPSGASRSSLASAIKPTELIETVGASVGALPTSRSCASDSVLVSQQMGGGNYSAHGMREALERLGAPEVNPDANAAQLEQQLASAFRAKAALEGTGRLDNVTALRAAIFFLAVFFFLASSDVEKAVQRD